MIALLFDVSGQRYALDASQIVEVVPAVRLRTLPGVPPHVAGIFRYRGAMVPVIDLSQLIGGTPAQPRLSTRLVLVRQAGPSGEVRVLGLIAEHATDGITTVPQRAASAGIATPEAPYLGALVMHGDETVQFVRVEDLLPAPLRARLFVEA